MSMSSPPAPTDTETISPTSGARGSPVFTPFPDDPYMLPLSSTSAPPSPDYTPATPHTDDEPEPIETSETRVTSPHFTTLSADSTSPPSPRRPPPT
ncbi:hypothetical protein Tco_1353370 [Tanacetum coccineum]